jgi:hypothetical protein
LTLTERFLEDIMTIFDRNNLGHRLTAEASTMSPLSRRTFVFVALATGILSTLPASKSVASEAEKRLVAGTRTLEVNGRAARVYSLIGPDGRPGIRLRAHEVATAEQSIPTRPSAMGRRKKRLRRRWASPSPSTPWCGARLLDARA